MQKTDPKKQPQPQPEPQPQQTSGFIRFFSRNKTVTAPPKKTTIDHTTSVTKSDLKNYEYNLLNKFETSTTFKLKIEKAMDSMIQFNNTYALIDGKMVADLYKDYVRVHEELQKQEARVKELRTLREEKKTLTEQLQKLQQEHEAVIKSYEQRIQQLTPVMSVEESVSRALEQANALFDHEKSALTLELSTTKNVKAHFCSNFSSFNLSNRN